MAAAAAAAALPRAGRATAFETRLKPVGDFLDRQVGQGLMPGYVSFVGQGADLSVAVGGTMGFGDDRPMRRDTIFRIQSMTKPVTTGTVMMLVEEGKVALDEPVDRLLPELADRRVLARIDAPLDDTVPAARPILVRDLMDFTFGFGLNFDPELPVNRAAEELQLVMGQPQPMTPLDPDAWMERFGSLPLMHQPGEQWLYNAGTLVLGVLIARIEGKPLDAVFAERWFEPLGMTDTGFFVPEAKLDRLAGGGYMTDPQSGKRLTFDGGAVSEYAAPPVFPSGSAGLVSTADDYLAFARVLLGGGMAGGRRYLTEASVEAMTTNRLSPEQIEASRGNLFPDFFDARGWGYGVATYIRPDEVSDVPGRYGWDGGYGTGWINDPNRDLVGIVLTQSSDFLFSPAYTGYWQAVYAATA